MKSFLQNNWFSSCHVYVDDKPIGQNPLVRSLHHQELQGYIIWMLDLRSILVIQLHFISITCITAGKGKPPHSLAVYAYSPDKQLCVVKILNSYLGMTKYRKDASRTHLLLSYRKAYREIASSSVWISGYNFTSSKVSVHSSINLWTNFVLNLQFS